MTAPAQVAARVGVVVACGSVHFLARAHPRSPFVARFVFCAVEIGVAIASLALGETRAALPLGCAILVIVACVDLAFAAMTLADSLVPARSCPVSPLKKSPPPHPPPKQWPGSTIVPGMMMITTAGADKTEPGVGGCTCGCAAAARARSPDRHAELVRCVWGTGGSHLPFVDAHNACPFLTYSGNGGGGTERVDPFEIALQLVGYSGILGIVACLLFAPPFSQSQSQSQIADAAHTLYSVALVTGACAVAMQVPVNLKSQCAYVAASTRTVHFAVLLFVPPLLVVATVQAASYTFGTLGLADTFVLVVWSGVIPLITCASSPPKVCDLVLDDAPRSVVLIHAAELFLFPWFGIWCASLASFWTWELVLVLGQASFAFPPGASASQDPGSDVVRLVLGCAAISASFLLVFDRIAHGVPSLLRVIREIPIPA